MTEELKEIGLKVGHRRVGRLMRKNRTRLSAHLIATNLFTDSARLSKHPPECSGLNHLCNQWPASRDTSTLRLLRSKRHHKVLHQVARASS